MGHIIISINLYLVEFWSILFFPTFCIFTYIVFVEILRPYSKCILYMYCYAVRMYWGKNQSSLD